MASGFHDDIEKAAGLGEGSPLLKTGNIKAATYGSDGEITSEATKKRFMDTAKSRFITHHVEVQDAMTYQTKDLANWSSLLTLTYTVWNRKSLWLVTLKLLGVASLVAVAVLCIVSNPAQLKVSRFAEICSFLRVFVGLLLGFFMSASVQRWWSCAEGFHNLCAAVRTLHIFINSLGVSEDHTLKLLRYAVSSAWILNNQLYVEALPTDEQDHANQARWEALEDGASSGLAFVELSKDELALLRDMADPPGALWMWVGSYMGFLAEEGVIPGLATPTYARLMGQVAEAFNAIRDVRSSITVQAPFIYVQMLSALVHINNIVNAISFGLTSGASIGTILVHWKLHASEDVDASKREAVHDTQTLLVSFFFSCFGPFVYQALLETSIAIAQPFSNKDAVVPTERMLRILQKDLQDQLRAAKKITWAQPCFKKPST